MKTENTENDPRHVEVLNNIAISSKESSIQGSQK